MKFRILAAAALLSMSGAAFAQTTSAPVTSPSDPVQAEETLEMDERDMTFFGGMDGMATPLFMDEEMSAMREGDDFANAFNTMTPEGQESVRAACMTALEDRGSHGTVTLGLCDQVGAL